MPIAIDCHHLLLGEVLFSSSAGGATLLSIDTRAALGSSSFASSFVDEVLFGSYAGGACLLSIDTRAALGSSSSASSLCIGVLFSSSDGGARLLRIDILLPPLLEME